MYSVFKFKLNQLKLIEIFNFYSQYPGYQMDEGEDEEKEKETEKSTS